MLTADFLDVLPENIISLYRGYEDSVITDIARRLAGLDYARPTAAWQAQRLSESGAMYDHILSRLSELTGRTEAELRSMFQKAGVKALAFDDRIYKAAGLNPLPLNLSPAMLQVMVAGLQKTNGLMRNLAQTTAISGQDAFINAADLAYTQISTGAFDYNTAIRQAVKQVASQGLPVVNYLSGRQDQLDVAMRRAVLTGVNQTVGILQIARADEMGCDLVETSAHVGARNKGTGPANHAEWQGKIYSRSGSSAKYPNFVEKTGYGTGAGLCGWNCVIGETIVSGPTIRAAYRRKYSGEIIVIRTSRGHELTVTPNHPILTDKGWIAAGLLAEGDNVFSRAGFNGMDGISPNPNHDESRIEDVFNSLSQSGDVFGLPASAGYFHGDVSDSKINVVFPQGFLRDRLSAKLPQDKEQISFGDAIKFPGSLITDGALNEIAFRSLHSSDGIMSGFGKPSTTLRPLSFEPGARSVRPVVGQRNAKPRKILPNQALGNSNLFCNLIFPEAGIIEGEEFGGGYPGFSHEIRLPASSAIGTGPFEAIDNSLEGTSIFLPDGVRGHAGRIEIDNIIFIERKSTQGSFIHVYNLETEGGWYYANGIITHNCRHSFYPFFEGISENAYSQAELDSYANKTVRYNGEEMSVYDATQQQRAIERAIRKAKREAGALEAAGVNNTPETEAVKFYQAKMRKFVKETGLNRQRERERI